MEKELKIKGAFEKVLGNKMKISLKSDNRKWSCHLVDQEKISKLIPDPEELLLTALVSSTLIALQLHIKNNHWNTISVAIETSLISLSDENRIQQTIFTQGATDEQKETLMILAQQSSIYSLLNNDIEIVTQINEE